MKLTRRAFGTSTLGSLAGLASAQTQPGWRWCSTCQSLFHGGVTAGVCVAGGSHDGSRSAAYLMLTGEGGDGQPGWNYCRNCQVLFYSGQGVSVCASTGGAHNGTGSWAYRVLYNRPNDGQAGWRFCGKCQGLVFAGNPTPGPCPKGGQHNSTNSYNYSLRLEGQAPSPSGARGNFRFVITGFTCHRETNDHILEADGRRDEVFVIAHQALFSRSGHILSRSDRTSLVVGDVGDGQFPNRIRAGTGGDNGGIRTGDSFPPREPWNIRGNPSRDRLPLALDDVELIDGENLVVIAPTIWEWDGPQTTVSAYNERMGIWLHALASFTGDAFRRGPHAFLTGVFDSQLTGDGSRYRLLDPSGSVDPLTGLPLDPSIDEQGRTQSLSDIGVFQPLPETLSGPQPLNSDANRPIGVRKNRLEFPWFRPGIIALGYRAVMHLLDGSSTIADGVFIRRHSRGVLEFIYRDDNRMRGHYSLFLRVVRV